MSTCIIHTCDLGWGAKSQTLSHRTGWKSHAGSDWLKSQQILISTNPTLRLCNTKFCTLHLSPGNLIIKYLKFVNVSCYSVCGHWASRTHRLGVYVIVHSVTTLTASQDSVTESVKAIQDSHSQLCHVFLCACRPLTVWACSCACTCMCVHNCIRLRFVTVRLCICKDCCVCASICSLLFPFMCSSVRVFAGFQLLIIHHYMCKCHLLFVSVSVYFFVLVCVCTCMCSCMCHCVCTS